MTLTTVSTSVGQDHNTCVDSSREAAQIAFCAAGEPPRIFCVMSNRQQQTDHQNFDRRFSLRIILRKIELLTLEFARVEQHVVIARVEQALSPQDRPTACSLENTGIAEVHHSC